MAEHHFTLASKICTKCKTVKPITEFQRDKSKSDGLRPSCKSCKAITSAAYRAANPEKVRAASAAAAAANPAMVKRKKDKYRAKPGMKEKEAAYTAAWRLSNPEKVKAMELARYANDPDGQKARVAAYRAANPDLVRAYAEAYRAANPEKCKASTDAWRGANPEKARAATAAWRAANPETARSYGHARRARILGSGGRLSKGLVETLFNLQKGKCPCCNQPLGDDYHMDHIQPLALGGSNTDDNIQLLRARCNLQKKDKHPVAFMQSRGFLL